MNYEELGPFRKIVVEATIDRLKHTYSDILERRGMAEIPEFFERHLYSPPNKDERDQALENLYSKLKTIAGVDMTANIKKLIDLNNLTDSLDYATAQVVFENKLIEEGKLSKDQLVAAMGAVGRFEERETQIYMISDVLKFFFSLSKLPLIKLVLAPIKVAAAMVGAQSLTETMEAGYSLTSKIKDLTPFVEAFIEREHRLIINLKENR